MDYTRNEESSWREYFAIKAYDPDQARDESGRWTAVGGGEGAAAERSSGEKRVGKELAPGVRVLSASFSKKEAAGKDFKGVSIQNYTETYALTHGLSLSKETGDKAIDSLDALVKQGKVTIEKETIPIRDKNAPGGIREQVSFMVKPTKEGLESMGKYGKVDPPTHSISASRPAAFQSEEGGIASEALAFRRSEYADSRHGVQGRFFSSSKDAPELTFDVEAQYQKLYSQERSKLERNNTEKLSSTQIANRAAGLAHAKIERHLEIANARQDIFGHEGGKGSKGQIDFYDAVSSQNALIGVLTNNHDLMRETKLIEGDAKKAYYNAFNKSPKGAKEIPYQAKDAAKIVEELPFLKGKDPEQIADAMKTFAKATFTAGGYGSGRGSAAAMGAGGTVPATLMAMQKMGLQTKGEWDPNAVNPRTGKVGMYKPMPKDKQEIYDRAVKIANQMRDNLDAHPSTKFTQGIRDAISTVAGTGFVFDNPVDGFKLPFDKHNVGNLRRTVGGIEVKVQVPMGKKQADGTRKDSVSPIKTRSGSSAILVQSLDKTVLGMMMLELKSPHTIHDSIGVARQKNWDHTKTPETVKAAVDRAMTKIQKADILGSLEKQITTHIKTLEKSQKMDKAKAAKAIAKAKLAFATMKDQLGSKDETGKPLPKPKFTGNRHFEHEGLKPYVRRRK